MAGDLALASYHDLKGKMIMQVNMKKGNGKNSITSKQFNRGLIFQLIATGTCNTRIELSRRTGLAKTTVTNIVAEFMEKGIVKECEEELTEVCGRNPIILKVADQAPKIIGILVFRTNIQAVLCSLDMQVFRTETIEFGELTGDILIQNAFELVDRMMEEEKNILGIGIASIGPVDIRNGIILNPPRFYGVKHVPSKKRSRRNIIFRFILIMITTVRHWQKNCLESARRNRISFFLLYPMVLVPALYVEERFFTVTEDLKQSLVMSALTVKDCSVPAETEAVWKCMRAVMWSEKN